MNNIPTEQVVTLELSVNDVNVVISALRELPHRVVNDLLSKVVAQAQRQVPPPPNMQAPNTAK